MIVAGFVVQVFIFTSPFNHCLSSTFPLQVDDPNSDIHINVSLGSLEHEEEPGVLLLWMLHDWR